MPLPETVTRSYLPRGSDDLGEVVAVTHEVGRDGTETLRSVFESGSTYAQLAPDFHERHEEVGTERLVALRARFRTTFVRSGTDDTVPGDPDHVPPIPCVTNGARAGRGLHVMFDHDAIEGPLAALMGTGDDVTLVSAPDRDAYVFVNAFGRLPDLDLSDVVRRALAGEVKILPEGWRSGEDVYLDVVPGEEVVTDDGVARRVYPVLEGMTWLEVEAPVPSPSP